MSNTFALAALLALTVGCAQRNAPPAEAANQSPSLGDSNGNGATNGAPSTDERTDPAEPAPWPVPTTSTPTSENTPKPADGKLKLSQARAMGCVGVR
jgi:hypothetical protein